MLIAEEINQSNRKVFGKFYNVLGLCLNDVLRFGNKMNSICIHSKLIIKTSFKF